MIANTIEFGDCRDTMRRWAAAGVRVQTCVTSPPYFGLRDYGHAGQIGLEETPEQFIAELVEVFRCVRDILADDGTLWVNIGDSYATGSKWGGSTGGKAAAGIHGAGGGGRNRTYPGLPDKNLIGIPWRLAFALQADGWILRQDIIWHKPNPMPESVTDRCTKAHEYIFLLSKSAKYFYAADAIRTPLTESSISRLSQPTLESQAGSDRVPGKTNGAMKAVRFGGNKYGDDTAPESRTKSGNAWEPGAKGANKRTVWTVAARPYKGAHFATYPPALIEPCILAGSRPGDIVLDPFMGSGTTAAVAQQHGRKYLGCELNENYGGLQEQRIAAEPTVAKVKRQRPVIAADKRQLDLLAAV